MPLTKLWIVSSILAFTACASRPDTDLCVVNAPAKNIKCYNLKRDYDDEGRLTPDAKPSYRPVATIEDLNKATCIPDPDHLANLKAWIRTMREEFEDCKNGKGK